MVKSSLKVKKMLWEKEKLFVTNNLSFSHSVFERLVLQTSKNQGLFEKWLKKCIKYHSTNDKTLDILYLNKDKSRPFSTQSRLLTMPDKKDF